MKKREKTRAPNKPTAALRLFARFYPYAKKDVGIILVALAALGGIIIAEMGMPILIRDAIDAFSLQESKEELITMVDGIGGRYFTLIVAILVFTFLQNYLMAIIAERFMLRLRGALFRHISAQSYSFFNREPTGKLISRITNDVAGIQELFGNILTGLLRNIATLAGIFVTMALINLRLTISALLALPIIIPISLLFNRRLRRASLC